MISCFSLQSFNMEGQWPLEVSDLRTLTVRVKNRYRAAHRDAVTANAHSIMLLFTIKTFEILKFCSPNENKKSTSPAIFLASGEQILSVRVLGQLFGRESGRIRQRERASRSHLRRRQRCQLAGTKGRGRRRRHALYNYMDRSSVFFF